MAIVGRKRIRIERTTPPLTCLDLKVFTEEDLIEDLKMLADWLEKKKKQCRESLAKPRMRTTNCEAADF